MPIVQKWLNVLPSERTALMLGFAFHFCVLASYYRLRSGGAGDRAVRRVWGWLCLWLARRQQQRAASKTVEGPFHEPH